MNNNGTVAFAGESVSVTDDVLGPIAGPDSGDASNPGVLDPGETWVYSTNGTAASLTSSSPNTVPGCGDDRPTYENVGTVNAGSVSDTDPSHYCKSGMVLDAFNDGPFVLNGPAGSSSVAATVPGGTRYMAVDDSGPSVTATVMSQVAGNDYLDISVGEPSGNYRISYGGMAATPSNHLNLDLTTSGADRLQLISSDAGPTGGVTFIVASGCTGPDLFDCVDANLTINLTGPGTYEILFTSFGSVDFTDIDHIAFIHQAGLTDNQNNRLEEFRTSGP